MSCISQILKKLPDEGHLVISHNNEPVLTLEGGGIYKNYEYVIVLNSNGFRCGYVALPPAHPLNDTPKMENSWCEVEDDELDYGEMDVECHYGLTFARKKHSLKGELGIACDDTWIGFDCGHVDDGIDFESMRKYYGDEYTAKRKYYLGLLCSGSVKSFDYVANECKSIIDQLIEKEAA